MADVELDRQLELAEQAAEVAQGEAEEALAKDAEDNPANVPPLWQVYAVVGAVFLAYLAAVIWMVWDTGRIGLRGWIRYIWVIVAVFGSVAACLCYLLVRGRLKKK